MVDKVEEIDRGDDIPGGGVDDTTSVDDKTENHGLTAEEIKAAEEALEKEEADAAVVAEADRKAKEKAERDEKVMIPKARFDEAVEKARRETEAAEARAKELEDQLKERQGGVDIAKIEQAIATREEALDAAIADGNKEKVAVLRKEIRNLDRQIASAEADVKSQYATAVAIEQIRYDALVSQLEQQYPSLNFDSDEFDAEEAGELMELKAAFEAAGQPSTEAMRKAVKALYRNGPQPAKKDDATETAEEKEAKAKAAEEKAAKRKEDAVKRALEKKGKQPSDVKNAGADSDKAGKTGTTKDVKKLSEKEYDALSESEIKRLRGDDA